MTDLPRVSLLVAMRNESAFIECCIGSILGQDYPPDKIEVIILDGQSEDDSKEKVSQIIGNNLNYHLIDNPGITQASAWNLGFLQSSGEIIGIMSAHCELAPDYVTNLVDTILRTKAEMVGGPTIAVSSGLVAKAISLALSSPFGVGDATFHYTSREIDVDGVFMGTCHRYIYQRLGGFDEEMVRNQDDEFCYRLRENGGRIICNPSIRSRYYNRTNIRSFWAQYYQYGFWKVRVLQKHPRQMRLRHFIPPLFILSLIISFLLGSMLFLIPSISLLILSISIPAVYLICNISASLIIAYKNGFKNIFFLPFTFFIMHSSYGLGFLVGLIKFVDRWHDKRGKVRYF